tara:strand:+ start:865 stop:2112 length:1248 start_codon:yes stop_codon:yes gene_type:complete
MPKFKDHKEWFKEAQRLHREQGLNAAQIKEKIGFYEGFRINNSSSKGIDKVNLAVKLKKDTLRNSKGKVPESTRQFFPSDSDHKTYTQTVGRDKAGINARTRQASQDRGILYNKGHIQSSDLGGSTTSRNLRLENGSNNYSHGRVSPSRGALLNTGAPVDWNNDAINYLDPDGLPYEYSPQARQRILNAPADMVDEVTAQVDKEVWDRINNNPDARPIRTNPNPRVSNPPTKQKFNGLSISAFDRGVTPNQALRIAKLKPKQLAQLGLVLPSVFGVAASAAETTLRTDKAAKSGSPLDWLQAGLSGTSLIADAVPVAGELVSTPADAANVFIDSALEPKVDRQQLLINQVAKANRIKNKPQPLPTNRGIRFEQNGKPTTGKAILNGKEITVPYGSVAGEGKNFAQKAWDSFNSLF